jgi:hypothetical protein
MAIFSFRRVSRVVTGFLLVALLWSCHDKGVEPKLPKDYVVYFAQFDFVQKVYAFHPTTLRLDSTDIPWNPGGGITVSADGSRLYLNDQTKVVVVDTGTYSLVSELPYPSRWPVAVSPDNQLVAVTGDDLHILRTSDYSVVFSDTDRTGNGWFSPDSKTFFCAAWGGGTGKAYAVNLADSTYPVTRKAFGGVVHVKPSMDQTKWFLYCNGGGASAFKVYDVSADSIIFQQSLYPGYGEFAVSPDGKYVFYTNPGRTGTDVPKLEFTIFDVKANQVSKVVTDTAIFSDSGKWVAPPNLVAVTPDSRCLTILGGNMSVYMLFLYDIQTQQLILNSISRISGVVNDDHAERGFIVCSLTNSVGYTAFIDSVQAISGVYLVEPYYRNQFDSAFLVGSSFCVAFNENLPRSAIDSINASFKVTIDHLLDRMPNVFVLQNTDSSGRRLLDITNLYYELPQTRYAHPEFGVWIQKFAYKLYDHYNWLQPHTKKVIGQFNSSSVWDFGGLSADTVEVAVIDNGVTSHEDLPASRILPGLDYGDNDLDPSPFDTVAHGMGCAGIIGASHCLDSVAGLSTSTGVISLNPATRIRPVKIYSDDKGAVGVTADK